MKGELAVKLFGRDLKELENKADQDFRASSSQIPGVADLGTFQVRGLWVPMRVVRALAANVHRVAQAAVIASTLDRVKRSSGGRRDGGAGPGAAAD